MHDLQSWITYPHTFNENNSQCTIYTYKEGVLSAIAHDLKIQVNRFDVELQANHTKVDGSSVVSPSIIARFWPDTCEVLGAVDAQGTLMPNVLKAKDLKQIKKNIQKDVLKTHKYPVIQFQGHIQQQTLKGQLEIHRQKREIHSAVHIDQQEKQIHISMT